MANDDRHLRDKKKSMNAEDPTGDRPEGKVTTGCGASGKLRQGEIITMTSSDRNSISEVRDAVGRRVRASYGELIQQPIPDKFLQLLDELQISEEAAKRRKS